jgi:lysine 6-dehydrogenase
MVIPLMHSAACCTTEPSSVTGAATPARGIETISAGIAARARSIRLCEPNWLQISGGGGQLQEFTNKTLRYPGHFEWLHAFKELGLFSEEPIQINGDQIVPREVYHTLLEPKISSSEIRDVCVIRVVGYGKKDGKETTVTIDLIDYYDEETGFIAMERLTGWHCAMMMGFQARGRIPAGGISMEVAVPAAEFMGAVRERGIKFKVRYE